MNLQKLSEDVQKGKITFNWKGHRRNRIVKIALPVTDLDELDKFRKEFWGEVHIARNIFFGLMREKVNLSEHNAFVSKEGIRAGQCFECGQELYVNLNGRTLEATTKCPYPQGHKEFGGEIKVPTGILLFADSLFQARPSELEPDANMTGIMWERSATEKAIKIDVGHGFCGNTCPSIFLRKDKKEILIGTKRTLKNGKSLNPHKDHELVGAIITDLWWWTICDKSIAENISKSGGGSILEQGEVQVEPGIWKVSQRGHLVDRDNWRMPQVFARLEWINDGG